MNEYIAFRQAHGIDDKSYKDLYLGDYFTINDGTYNMPWMVAHFDYYYNAGDDPAGVKGVVLIPAAHGVQTKMKDPASTSGGYIESIAHTTTCPAVASALSRVFGSYLISNRYYLTNSMNPNMMSMCGLGMTGTANNAAWYSSQCELVTDAQIFGTSFSSSGLDVGESASKLAVFNFRTVCYGSRANRWTRCICNGTNYIVIGGSGMPSWAGAHNNYYSIPLIYIG